MRPAGLIDAGAVVALLDRNDSWHARVVAAVRTARMPLATTAAAVAEVFHLLESHEHPAAWGFLRSGAVAVLPIGDADLDDIESLMTKYADRPMDFADATLVRLARRERLTTILTVDDDFLVYRIEGRRGFTVLPRR